MTDLKWQIDDHYSIRSMTEEEFEPLFEKHGNEIFDDSQIFRIRPTWTPEDHEKINKLRANMGKPFELRLGVFHNSDFVGWHYGRQDSPIQFYMQNSAILPAHRRKGLYNALMKRVLEITTEMGFQDIWSRHNATNNDVIIPKLKQGFTITAMEVTDIFGTLVHLHYFPKEIRRKVMDYRVGQIKPDDEIKKSLGI
jgi:hypothetical protein